MAVWSGGGLKLADNGTKNVGEHELNHRLGYAIIILYNWDNTFTRGVT